METTIIVDLSREQLAWVAAVGTMGFPLHMRDEVMDRIIRDAVPFRSVFMVELSEWERTVICRAATDLMDSAYGDNAWMGPQYAMWESVATSLYVCASDTLA